MTSSKLNRFLVGGLNYLATVVMLPLALGLIVAWYLTSYASSSIPGGRIAYPICCVIYSLQWVCLSVYWFWSIKLVYCVRITSAAVIAVALELIQSRLFGPVWIVTTPALFLAVTPLAQWVGLISTCGLSAIFYFAIFVALPRFEFAGGRRFQGIVIAFVIFAAFWIGGRVIETNVSIRPISFSVALVQPNIRPQKDHEWEPWRKLCALTDKALINGSECDLIIWPEAVLSPTSRNEIDAKISGLRSTIGGADSRTFGIDQREPASLSLTDMKTFDLATLFERYHSYTKTNFLVGSVLFDRNDVSRYGITISEIRRHNCACLLKPAGETEIYEKRVLMPFVEYVPTWLDCSALGSVLFTNFRSAELTPGDRFRVLTFTDSQSVEHRIGVCICYESWLPWLPQYHTTERLDAICHLMYDADFADQPDYACSMLKTIQLRAIETRTWQLVCSCWAGTAVVDPRGQIVAQSNAKSFVLSYGR
jgi:apolipoprotein N-acyltransferase